MTPIRRLALGILVAGLVAVRWGLDLQPEKEEENRYTRLADLPASDMVPTYIASLFFGSFRAVAVDVLWIQLKRIEEERRWYERRETLKLISYFQPRNPEVWAHLGWHSAYNVANGFNDPASRALEPDSRAWEWIRFGLTWLREGIHRLPDSTYLKFEMAFTLSHKPSWRDFPLDATFLRRIEEDGGLQRELLPPGVEPGERPRSAFELATLWLEAAKDDLRKAGDTFHRSQMGLLIHVSTLDGMVRRCAYLQGIHAWESGRWEEAVESFRRAERQARRMTADDYPGPVSGIYLHWIDFYAGLPGVVELDRKSRSGAIEDRRAFLAAFQDLIVRSAVVAPLDEGFLWGPDEPEAPLNRLKRELGGNLDPQECNDGFALATLLHPGKEITATMDPPGLDVDYYSVELPRDEEAGEVTVSFHRPGTSSGTLQVTVYDTYRQTLAEGPMRLDAGLTFRLEKGMRVTLKVEPSGEAAPGASYSLRCTLGPTKRPSVSSRA